MICDFPGCRESICKGDRVVVRAIGDGDQQEQVVYHAWHFDTPAVSS